MILINNKPKLLVYAISWNEKRNLFFSRYLSDYFNVIIISSFNSGNKLIDIIKPAKIIGTSFLFKGKVGLSFSFSFKRSVKEIQPSYVMTIETHSISSYQAVKLAEKFKYKSVIFSWQNLESIPKYFFQSYIQKKVLKESDYLLAGTLETKKYLIKKGAFEDKIFVNIETGYDETIFSKVDVSLRVSWGFKEEDFIVMYAGRLIEEKGIKIVLAAAKKIEFVNSQIKFVLIGEGYLEKFIRNFDSKNVFFKNHYDFSEMGIVLRSCDLFIYPSISSKYWAEQFGYSVVEALACGKPVVVSDSGNLNKLVKNEITGSIVMEGDVQSLVEKILFWFNKLQSKEKREEIGASKFSGSNVAYNYKRILLDNDYSLLEN